MIEGANILNDAINILNDATNILYSAQYFSIYCNETQYIVWWSIYWKSGYICFVSLVCVAVRGCLPLWFPHVFKQEVLESSQKKKAICEDSMSTEISAFDCLNAHILHAWKTAAL